MALPLSIGIAIASGVPIEKAPAVGLMIAIIGAIVVGSLSGSPPQLSGPAAILLLVGYKLAKPELFKRMYATGLYHFIPFVATILGLVFTDLLTGIGIGMAIAIFMLSSYWILVIDAGSISLIM